MPSSVTVTAQDDFSFGDVALGGNPGTLQIPPKFPLSLAATRDLLNWANTFPSLTTPVLNATISSSASSIVLATDPGDQFPTDSFEVSIDDEIVFVATRSGATLNGCVRGAENTVPAIHLIGATVQLLITALSHNQVVAELLAIEQTLGVSAQHFTPVEIGFTSTRGDFFVAHGLPQVPRRAGPVIMTSGGLVYFQTIRFDAVNLYLTASDDGLTGYVQVWL